MSVVKHAVVRRRPAPGTGLDASLVGCFPTPGDLAGLTGLSENALSRDQVRTLLSPDGRARLPEEATAPLGSSGLNCLPLFTDELTSEADLAARSARAIEHAASPGAFVGCGSIGMSPLRRLLARSPRPPAGMTLCDFPESSPLLRRLAAELASRVAVRRIRVIESGPAWTCAVYEAEVLVTAVGGTAAARHDGLLPSRVTAPGSPHGPDGASNASRARAPPGCHAFHHAHSEPLNRIPRPRREKQVEGCTVEPLVCNSIATPN
ncbi:hypothetical protein [Streptomyces sp.]|uniref:hypothetical protein n=1 Tax=Streptomyces sp. TaxID=1931 RepID=UPI002D79E72B|nr:hypothetical protein [Streptomyces sp.]HET6358908.1 hypothetical protein [Streptomyces sp.]